MNPEPLMRTWHRPRGVEVHPIRRRRPAERSEVAVRVLRTAAVLAAAALAAAVLWAGHAGL